MKALSNCSFNASMKGAEYAVLGFKAFPTPVLLLRARDADY